jgi:hypothetical protein
MKQLFMLVALLLFLFGCELSPEELSLGVNECRERNFKPLVRYHDAGYPIRVYCVYVEPKPCGESQ